MRNIKFKKFLPKNRFKKNIFDSKKFNNIINNFNNFTKVKQNVFYTFSKDFNLNIKLTELHKFKKKFKRVIIIGMGGSILGSKAIYYFLKKKIKKKFLFIDNLNEIEIENIKKEKNLKNSLFLIISKSGNTIETLAVIESLKKAYFSKNNTIVITENKRSELNNFARKKEIKIIYHRNYIGGRYSVFSETGIIPAYLMGLNINKIRKDSLIHFKNKNELKNNLINLLKIYSSKNINSLVLLNYSPELNFFMSWLKQLIAESLGKRGKGLIPIHSTAPMDHHSLLQLYLDGPKDKFFYIFCNKTKKSKKTHNIYFSNKLFNSNINQIKEAQKEALLKVLKYKNIPFTEIEIDKIKEETLGQLFSYFILETILIGKKLNINPFDQPAIEEVKKITKKILSS